MNELLTIALPVYKRTDFIKSALDSAVNQTVKCKILIIDNNSPHDEFKKITEDYPGSNIKYINNSETVAQEDNFNLCFQNADTPWVTILHDDDMLHYQYVEFCQELITLFSDKLDGIMFKTHVGEDEWELVGTEKKLTNDIRKLKQSYFHFFNTPFPGVLVRRDEAIKLGGFNKDFHPYADLDFWYRYSKENNFYLAMQEMSYFRISSSQVSSKFSDKMINETYKYRSKEIELSAHNNFLAKLCLEYVRINNIKYFEETYSDFQIPQHLPNELSLIKARKLLKYRLISGLVRKYINKLSYSTS